MVEISLIGLIVGSILVAIAMIILWALWVRAEYKLAYYGESVIFWEIK